MAEIKQRLAFPVTSILVSAKTQGWITEDVFRFAVGKLNGALTTDTIQEIADAIRESSEFVAEQIQNLI